MAVPEGVWVDSIGTLWVGEFRNHRVTRFDDAAGKTGGAPADGVLGQPGFDSSVSGSGPDQLFNPYGVTVDSTDTLWVADVRNNRVVRFSLTAVTTTPTPLDTTPPTLQVRGRKTIETLRKRVVFRGTASDNASGIDQIEIKTRRGAKVRKIKRQVEVEGRLEGQEGSRSGCPQTQSHRRSRKSLRLFEGPYPQPVKRKIIDPARSSLALYAFRASAELTPPPRPA